MTGRFTSVLIANRGEIAVRIIRTLRRLGLRAIAVYSEADAAAPHVRLADAAYPIGPAPARDSYLKIEAILAAAKASGAEAIHPGYGFLSENEHFADAIAAAGLTFIGPPASAIRAMGSKSEAKALMERAGVPLVPGYHGADQDPSLLAREAERIGFPVLIKPSAGGGGKGMKIVRDAAEFADALDSGKREARSSFGDDRVLIERYLERPRHIEMQIFADSFGETVHLFERDCSIQRRHQKVVEEAPAPGLDPAMREAMGAAAVAAARAVGYVGAGTIEFIVEGDRFHFMEMNTRLQVEHPVTEAITGLDLVEWQVRVAQGEPLKLRQDQITQHGHAVEVRLYAEDPAKGFLPQAGTLRHLAVPAGEGVRIDAGVVPGSVIPVHYDPMIAKLIAHGSDRPAALARLRAALAATEVVGVATNRAFLQAITAHPAFAAAELDTGFIVRHEAELLPAPALDRELLSLASLARLLRDAAALGDESDPWAALAYWRPNLDEATVLHFGFGEHVVAVQARRHGAVYRLVLQDGEVEASGTLGADGTLTASLDGVVLTARAIFTDGGVTIFAQGSEQSYAIPDPTAPSAGTEAAGGHLRAPMPGTVVRVAVTPGDNVVKGAPLVVVEAMKMEHALVAPRDGRVATVRCAVGDQVAEGEELVALEEAP